MIEPEFVAYLIALVSLAVSFYALWELSEAKEYGKKWMKLTKDLKDRIEELESRRR